MSYSSSPRHEFDYVEHRSCLRSQCNCLCGTGACRCCCRCCPPVKESTFTRSVYIFFLIFFVGAMAVFMSKEVQSKILNLFPDNYSICDFLGSASGCHAGTLMGYIIVYRIGFAISLYHLILGLITFRIRSSKDCRAALHNGMWLYKFMLIIVLLIVAFFIPDTEDHILTVWMYIAMTGGATFIVIQLILLVFMLHSWTDRIQKKAEASGGRSPFTCYAVVSPGLAIINFLLCGAGVVVLYIYFASSGGCHRNQWFILINGGACVIVAVVAGVRRDSKPVGLRLLHASMVCLYVLYLTWNAIISAPRKHRRFHNPYSLTRFDRQKQFTASFQQEYYCGPTGGEDMWADISLPYINLAITFLIVIYQSIRISEPKNCHALELPDCPITQIPQSTHEKDDTGGQVVIRNEKQAVIYSYSIFHFVLTLACMLMMMHLTGWYMPDRASLTTFGRSWSAVWIKMSSSWACLVIYISILLWPTILPFNRHRRISVPVVEVNGHAFESDSDEPEDYKYHDEDEEEGEEQHYHSESEASRDAVPLTKSKRPTIIRVHQETTV